MNEFKLDIWGAFEESGRNTATKRKHITSLIDDMITLYLLVIIIYLFTFTYYY